MQYYDRYSEFHFNGEHKVVPAINLNKKGSDVVVTYKKVYQDWINFHNNITGHRSLIG